eukprot:gene1725-1923_t
MHIEFVNVPFQANIVKSTISSKNIEFVDKEADTYDRCVKNIIDTVTLLDSLGFVVHPKKSVFIPAKTITFLGFVLDSVNMTVYLTQDRAHSIKRVCDTVLSSTCLTIRQVAQLLGKITSSFPGAMFGPLYYRNLDMNKTKALKEAKGNFDQVIKLSQDAIAEIQWWGTHVPHLFNKIDHGNPQIILYSDASKIGWGCSCNDIKSGGNWNPEEAQFHINYLEMLAAYFALKAFTTEPAHKHVKLMVDNTTVDDRYINSSIRSNKDTPIAQETTVNHVPFVRRLLQDKGISDTAADIIGNSWRAGTKKQYRSYITRWEKYCSARNINPLSANVIDGINFPGKLFSDGLSYSSINTARSALSNLIYLAVGSSFGCNGIVTKFMRGVFCMRPKLPRYKEIWDVSIVLTHIKSWYPFDSLTLKILTLKTITLMALTSGQRCQTLQALQIDQVQLDPDTCIFQVTKLLKTSTPQSHFGVVIFNAYASDEKLCMVSCLKEYIERTEALWKSCRSFFVSYVKPHNMATVDTISRWLKETLNLSGIDVERFKAHSFRAAATSATKAFNVPIEHIMETANWKSAETFRKYYDKPIIKDNKGFGGNPPIDVEALLRRLETLERGKEVGMDQLKKDIVQYALRQSSDFDKYVALNMASATHRVPVRKIPQLPPGLLGNRDYERVVKAISKLDKVFGVGENQRGKFWRNQPSLQPPSLMSQPPRPGPYQVPDRQQQGRRRRCFICNDTGHMAARCFRRQHFNADGRGTSRPHKRQ